MLPGKLRHDTEIMITCDRVINLEFDVFLKAIHNGRNIINTAKSETVRSLCTDAPLMGDVCTQAK